MVTKTIEGPRRAVEPRRRAPSKADEDLAIATLADACDRNGLRATHIGIEAPGGRRVDVLVIMDDEGLALRLGQQLVAAAPTGATIRVDEDDFGWEPALRSGASS